jgi:hypothetical protein
VAGFVVCVKVTTGVLVLGDSAEGTLLAIVGFVLGDSAEGTLLAIVGFVSGIISGEGETVDSVSVVSKEVLE